MRRKTSSLKPAKSAEVVNVALAKARLPELIERAAGGEEIILARAGKPRARLVALDTSRKALRVPGKGKGRFRISSDFDEPLPPEVLASFEEGAS